MFENSVLVKKERGMGMIIGGIACFIGMLICFLFGIVAPFVFGIPGVALGIAAVCILFFNETEFEYYYLDGDFRITKIKNRNKRKRLIDIALDKAVIIAPASSASLEPYLRNREVYKFDYSSGKHGESCYGLVYNGDEGTDFIYFEPNERMLNAMRMKYAKIIMK